MKKEKLWQAVLSQIQFLVSEASFETWFKNTKPLGKERGCLFVAVPNSFVKEWLENKYSHLLIKLIRKTDAEIKKINYIVQSLPQKKKLPLRKVPQLHFEEFEIDKKTNLNPRYSFKNFVVGDFNQLAYAAAISVTENLGKTYNPLFVYGGVGLGKTHLLQAIGNKIKRKRSNLKILYLPANKLTSKIISSLQNKTIGNLTKELSRLHCLIVDDVQFLSGKEKTQEIFFHLFNELYQRNHQIILSSDRPPKAISSLEERLRSRFEGGMIADIGIPDFETRLAILKVKMEEKNVVLLESVLNYIASSITDNIRELEGALNQVIIYQQVNEKLADLETAKRLLKNLVFSPSKVATFKKIIEKVAKFYDLKPKDLFQKTRKKEIVKPRQIAMYLIKKELKASFSSIGRKFGQKDHSTVIHAYKKILKEIKENQKLNEEIEFLKQEIYRG